MKKLVFLAALAALTLTAPAIASASNFKGVVVAKNAKRHTLAVASSTGVVRTVRTTKLGAAIGNRVAVSAKALRDGTFRASNVAIRGKARHARIHGVVARRLRGGLLLSAGHSMLRVKTGRRTAAAGGGGSPNPGDVVNTTVTVTSNGELDDDNVESAGHTDSIELDGTLFALIAPSDSTAGSLTVKVGDLSFDVVVPAGFKFPSNLKVGDRVQLKASVSGSTMTLLKLEGDNNNDNNNDDDGDNNDNNNNDDGDNGGGDGN
jgi:hypothetical protein